MAEEKPKKPRGMNIQIQADEDTAQGIYANFAVINHTENEFVLDFIYVQPGQPKGKLRTRVIISPKHARRLLGAVQRNVEMYEKKFGAITLAKGPGGEDDLVH